VADVLEMHPDLMGSAGVELETEQLGDIEPCYHRRVGSREPTQGRDGHPFSILGVPGDGGLDAKLAGIEVAPGECRVASAHPASSDGRAQPAMSQVRLGDDHEARGIPVQSVNDAGPPLRSTGQRRSPRDQRVHEGIVPVPRRRMDDQTGRFVDDGEVFVLKDDREWDRVGLESPGRLLIGDPDGDALTSCDEARGTGRFSIDLYALVSDEARRLRPGESQLIGEKAVEPLRQIGRDREGKLRQPKRIPVPAGWRPPAKARPPARELRSSPRCPPD
jgi:hypothetical protein